MLESLSSSQVESEVRKFVETAKTLLGSDLKSAILFGSLAEGKWRKSSDVNLILVLNHYSFEKANLLRESYRQVFATIKLKAMFILDSELEMAAVAFADKFNDISNRHRVLFGDDVVAKLKPSRSAQIQRLKQVILNLSLRLRESNVLVGLREEQLWSVITDATGPVRSFALTILELKGKTAENPKGALQILNQELNGSKFDSELQDLSTLRETLAIAPGRAQELIKFQLTILDQMKTLVEGF